MHQKSYWKSRANYFELRTYKKVGRFSTFIGEIIGEIIANLLSYNTHKQKLYFVLVVSKYDSLSL